MWSAQYWELVWAWWRRILLKAAMQGSVVRRTQELLGRVIRKPPLTERLLSKPPFRYLHDVIGEVRRSERGGKEGEERKRSVVFPVAWQLEEEAAKETHVSLKGCVKRFPKTDRVRESDGVFSPSRLVQGLCVLQSIAQMAIVDRETCLGLDRSPLRERKKKEKLSQSLLVNNSNCMYKEGQI